MKAMRKVLFTDDEDKIAETKGYFHQWGMGVFEGNQYSTAIIEDENGGIHTPFPWMIKFIDKPE
jgi:hypothetical protein